MNTTLLLLLVLFVGTTFAKLPRSECTILKSPLPLPPVGVVCANPDRARLIATQYLDYFYVHTDFRGYQVYVGEYQKAPLFVAFIGLGSASAAFIMEELAAYDAKVVVRLGTNDYNTTEADINKVYVVQECHGLYGLFRDYGFPAREWGRGIPSDTRLVQSLLDNSAKFPEIQAIRSIGYNIDAFYSFFDPENVAKNVTAVNDLIRYYQQDVHATVRDMETCAVLLVGEMRGMQTASVLQAVVKHGSKHEGVGTTGIYLVLETLKQQHLKIMDKYNEKL